MQTWEAIVLGIIQGLTEFLPISSTAHLLVGRQFMGHENPRDSFTTAIQLGTLFAVFVYFRSDIVRLSKALIADFRQFRFGSSTDSRLCWKIAVGTIPAVVCGFVLRKFIKEQLYSMHVIAGAAIFFALLLMAAEVVSRRRKSKGNEGRKEEEITWFDAIVIGCFQAVALIPGGSRSGCTITGALFAGLSRPTAARFSFLLSLPIILGAGLYDLYKERRELLESQDQMTNLVIGTVVAGIVGYVAIAWLMNYLNKHSTFVFIGYRLILGIAMLLLLAAGTLKEISQ